MTSPTVGRVRSLLLGEGFLVAVGASSDVSVRLLVVKKGFLKVSKRSEAVSVRPLTTRKGLLMMRKALEVVSVRLFAMSKRSEVVSVRLFAMSKRSKVVSVRPLTMGKRFPMMGKRLDNALKPLVAMRKGATRRGIAHLRKIDVASVDLSTSDGESQFEPGLCL